MKRSTSRETRRILELAGVVVDEAIDQQAQDAHDAKMARLRAELAALKGKTAEMKKIRKQAEKLAKKGKPKTASELKAQNDEMAAMKKKVTALGLDDDQPRDSDGKWK